MQGSQPENPAALSLTRVLLLVLTKSAQSASFLKAYTAVPTRSWSCLMYPPRGRWTYLCRALKGSGATHLDGVVSREGLDGLAGDMGWKAAR